VRRGNSLNKISAGEVAITAALMGWRFLFCREFLMRNGSNIMNSVLQKWLDARRVARKEAWARQVFPDRPNKIKYYPGCSWFRVLGSERLYLWLSTFGFTTHRPDDHYRGWRMFYKWGVCAVPPWRAERHGVRIFGRSRQELRHLIDFLSPPSARFSGAALRRTTKRLRAIGDFPVRVYDEFILWLWSLLQRWWCR
jgi:hypothetical protein